MGITGLIPFLEKSSTKINVRNLRGSSVAVDTYCWLHKGSYSCADKLCRGEKTDRYFIYIYIKRKLLQFLARIAKCVND